MDSHDLAHNRHNHLLTFSPTSPSQIISIQTNPGPKPQSPEQEDESLLNVLNFLSSHDASELKPQPPKVLVVSIESDGLFAPPEQVLVSSGVRGSEFVSVRSTDGHDGFLLEFEQINTAVGEFLRRCLAFIYDRSPIEVEAKVEDVKQSVFGEVEDVTRW